MYIDLHRKKLGMMYSKIFTVVMVCYKKERGKARKGAGAVIV